MVQRKYGVQMSARKFNAFIRKCWGNTIALDSDAGRALREGSIHYLHPSQYCGIILMPTPGIFRNALIKVVRNAGFVDNPDFIRGRALDEITSHHYTILLRRVGGYIGRLTTVESDLKSDARFNTPGLRVADMRTGQYRWKND